MVGDNGEVSTSGQPRLLDLLRADFEATTHGNFRHYGLLRFWMRVAGKVVLGPNVRAVASFRIAHALADRGLLPLALLLRGRAVRSSGAEIHPLAAIGPGLVLVHSVGVVIGPDAKIGARVRIHQGVTLGDPVHTGAGVWAGPQVGDDVVLGAHAVLLGGIHVGDRAVVGANAVVTSDVAADSRVGGIPARLLRSSRE